MNTLDQYPAFVFVTYICLCHWHSQNCLLAQASVLLEVVQIVATDQNAGKSEPSKLGLGWFWCQKIVGSG